MKKQKVEWWIGILTWPAIHDNDIGKNISNRLAGPVQTQTFITPHRLIVQVVEAKAKGQ
jgi:hypothetical protein